MKDTDHIALFFSKLADQYRQTQEVHQAYKPYSFYEVSMPK